MVYAGLNEEFQREDEIQYPYDSNPMHQKWMTSNIQLQKGKQTPGVGSVMSTYMT